MFAFVFKDKMRGSTGKEGPNLGSSGWGPPSARQSTDQEWGLADFSLATDRSRKKKSQRYVRWPITFVGQRRRYRSQLTQWKPRGSKENKELANAKL